jgi:hypothetical protein
MVLEGRAAHEEVEDGALAFVIPHPRRHCGASLRGYGSFQRAASISCTDSARAVDHPVRALRSLERHAAPFSALRASGGKGTTAQIPGWGGLQMPVRGWAGFPWGLTLELFSERINCGCAFATRATGWPQIGENNVALIVRGSCTLQYCSRTPRRRWGAAAGVGISVREQIQQCRLLTDAFLLGSGQSSLVRLR